MNRTQYVAMYQRLAQTRTQYTECIKITRMDGVSFRFTAHDKTLSIWETDGHVYSYVPAGAFQLTALENQSGLAVSNMDIDAIITDDHITEDDLLAGKFDYANVELFIAYWSNSQVGVLPLRTSWIGDLRVEGIDFRAELRGIAQKLAQVFVETTSLECRYDFCDVHYVRSHCGLSRAAFEKTYTIQNVVSRGQFTVNIQPADYGKYGWGLATFISGANAGLEMEVTHNDADLILLFLNMPYTIKSGDQLKLLQGCDKSYTTCKDTFNNLVNFGGEPFLAGADVLQSYKLVQIEGGGAKGGSKGKGSKSKGTGSKK